MSDSDNSLNLSTGAEIERNPSTEINPETFNLDGFEPPVDESNPTTVLNAQLDSLGLRNVELPQPKAQPEAVAGGESASKPNQKITDYNELYHYVPPKN